jgi:tRNA dimethylallyltransferase
LTPPTVPPPIRFPILVGPTGVGKSEIAFLLAKEWKAEILSADAFQVYREVPVGTAQPPQAHQKEIRHHLIACLDFTEKWSSVEFAKKSAEIIQSLQAQNQKLVLVGGSGFYIKSLVEGSPGGEAPSAELRGWIAGRIAELGKEKAHQWLAERSPEAGGRIHINDTYRIARALEKTYGTASPRPAAAFHPGQFKFYGLERSRDRLDQLLRDRIEKMWTGGLLSETERLKKIQVDAGHPIWAAIGYQEAEAYLGQKLTSHEAKEKIFRRSRQYAKRQWTWFKHQHSVQWIDLDGLPGLSDAARFILDDLAKS